MTHINNQINEQINKLETELGINLPVDYRKFLQDQAMDLLLGKSFYDEDDFGYVYPKTISCVFETERLLKRKQEYIERGYFNIGIAGGEDIYIGINKDIAGKIFYYKWVGFNEYFIDPEDVDTYRQDDIYCFKVIADNLGDFVDNLLPKLPGEYKEYNLIREKSEEIKNLKGTARMQYLILMASAG